jgi:hypothetical protein
MNEQNCAIILEFHFLHYMLYRKQAKKGNVRKNGRKKEVRYEYK